MLGLSQKRSLVPSLAALVSFVVAAPLLSSAARAQDAPVIGGHYAARASDTGFAGAVNSSGGYGASVPLDLPPVRGGLPLPLRVVSGGNQVGAAGLGWEVPLSFIRRDLTIAHRRPVNTANVTPQAREQLSLALGGSRTDLIRNGADTAWLARRDDAQIEVRDVGGGVLEMYDGNNLRYSFSSDGGGVGALDNGNLYLLRDIFGPGGSRVHLDYTFGAPGLGGGSTGLSIDLASVSYNFDSTGACAKHIVNLNYDADASLPLSFSMLGSTALVRLHKLRELGAIDVTARESAADSPQPCTGAMKSLRAYNFSYQADADTGQQRLRQVTMIGQEGTAERNVTLPLATYTYGQFTGSDGTISYLPTPQSIPLPSDFTNQSIAQTVTAQNPIAAISNTITSMGLIDLNGDGRPDLVNATFPGFMRNRPGPGGTTSFSDLNSVTLPQSDELSRAFVPVAPQFGGDLVQYGVAANRNYVDKRLIDMNGDGRLDIVDSTAQANAWVVYLNTPDLADPNHTIWVPRTISILPMVQRLVEAGLLLDGNNIMGTPITDPSQVTFLPLGRSFTSNVVHFHHCYIWTGSAWITPFTDFYPANCTFPQFDYPVLSNYGGDAEDGQTSFVEWELKDVNGDGYPDLVYNASPVVAQLVGGERPLQDGTEVNQVATSDAIWSPAFTGSHAVKALINVAGVHLDQATSAFSSPIVLDADEAGCGVEQWVPGFGALGRSNQVCGFEDVNGDGLVDRLRTLVLAPGELTGIAHLGTGQILDPSGNIVVPFSGPTIFLPGPIARSQRQVFQITDGNGTHFGPPPSVCPTLSNNYKYAVQRTAGLRDLNGDGIPDYILGTNARQGDPASTTSWKVAFGTGTGFAPPVMINAPLHQ
jgi:hypothetical protein